MSHAANVIEIPFKDSDEVVEVSLDELQDDASEILDILRTESSPLSLYRRFALEYYRRGKLEAFKQVLVVAISITVPPEQYADRIQLLDILAANFLNEALREKDRSKRERLFAEATNKYNEAGSGELSTSSELNESNWVGKGYWLLLRGDLARADFNFGVIFPKYPENIPAIIGKACIAFREGKFKDSLGLFKKALTLLPTCPASIRYGIGLCYFKLGKTDKAKAAFDRTLELDPDNVEALLGSAIIDFNAGTAESERKGRLSLKRAHDLDRSHSVTLNLLADYFFKKQDYDKAHSLALNAFQNTDVDQIKSESCYILAKNFHVQLDFDNAFRYYNQATKLAPESILASFGLGQMYLKQDNKPQAIACFEKVIAKEPENYETLKILASLYAEIPEKQSTAIEYLRLVFKHHDDDVEAWIELAQLLEGTNPEESLEAYLKAESIFRDIIKIETAPEILNNIGVLYFKKANHEKALTYFQNALNQIDSKPAEEVSPETKLSTVSIRYNIGRVYEQTLKINEAVEIYKQILREHPNYIDCFFRLGCIALGRNDRSEALDQFQDAIGIEENADAWTLIGITHAMHNEVRIARKKFERTLTTVDKNDIYSLLQVGNVWLAHAEMENTDSSIDFCTKKALEFFERVLKINNQNVYAANGLGIVLAERGSFEEARDVFSQIRDAAKDNVDILMNLGHVYSELGQHVSAIKMYESCLRRSDESVKDHKVFGYISRAYHRFGKVEKEPANVFKAIKNLQKAIHARPGDQLMRYNICVLSHDYAFLILNRHSNLRSATDLSKAVEYLRVATRMLYSLSKIAGPELLKYVDKTKIGQLLKECDKHKAACRAQLVKQAEEESLREKKIAQMKLTRQQELDRKKEEEEREKKKKEDELARIEDHRRELNEKMKDFIQHEIDRKQEEQEAAARRRESSRKRQEADASGEDDERTGDASGRDEEPKQRKRRGPQKSRKRREVHSESPDEQEDDDDDENEPIIRPAKKRRSVVAAGLRSELSKETVSSDDEANPEEMSDASVHSDQDEAVFDDGGDDRDAESHADDDEQRDMDYD